MPPPTKIKPDFGLTQPPTSASASDSAKNQPIITPSGVGLKIDDVNKSVWQYIRQRKMWEFLLIVPFLFAWEAFIIYLFINYMRYATSGNANSGKGFGNLFFLPFALFGAWFYKIKKQFEDAFLQEFANSNGYTFDKLGVVNETYGSIFRISNDQKVSDVISGTYDGTDLRLFLLELTVQEGRNRVTLRDTVLEIDMHGTLPNLLLTNKSMGEQSLRLQKSFGIKNSFTLEGDFNKYFDFYGRPENQVEAYEVFSPDIMALMEDESKHFSVEFAGNRIYIYANDFIGTTDELTQAFALAKRLIEKLTPLAHRLQSDSTIIPTPVNVIKFRKQHPLVGQLGAVFFVILMIAAVGLLTFGVISAKNQATNDLPEVEGVTDAWMQDIARHDTADARTLESPGLASDTGHLQFLNNGYFPDFATAKIIGHASGHDSGHGLWISVLYEDDAGSRPYYIKFGLSKHSQTWQNNDYRIWFFETSYNHLKP